MSNCELIELKKSIEEDMKSFYERLECLQKSEQVIELQEQFKSFQAITKAKLTALENRMIEMEVRIERLETKERGSSLLIHGLQQEDHSKSLNSVVEEFLKKEVGITSPRVRYTHRLGRKTLGKEKPIVVEFANPEARLEVLRSRKKLKGTSFLVTEFLTKSKQNLLHEARKLAGRDAWAYNGRILVRVNDRVLTVGSIASLEDIRKELRGAETVPEIPQKSEKPIPPLCLFYFSHPFGVLSPNPPSVSKAPGDYLQQTLLERINAQPWLFANCPQPTTSKPQNVETSTCLKPNSSTCTGSHSPNAKPSLKVKKIKSQNYGPKRNNSKSNKVCNKFVNTEYSKSDECKTIDGSNDFEEEFESNKTMGKRNSECRNLTCCGETHLVDKERSSVRPKRHGEKIIREYQNKPHLKKILPPIDRPTKLISEDRTYRKWLDVDHQRNNFRLKAFLPPIDHQDYETVLTKPEPVETDPVDANCDEINENCNESNIEIHVEMVGEEFEKKPKKKKVRRKIRRCVKSSSGVNKGRGRPHRSAARKLVNCLLQSVHADRRAPTATLPALSEVLNTVKEAWSSPRSLLPRYYRYQQMSSSPAKHLRMLDSKEKCSAKAGASPGLLRRRYSVPETVMRKYKLAQLKSDTEESDVGSAPSPSRGNSPARRLAQSNNQIKGFLGSVRPSPLLRRLWGRQGGSHSELRFWDSCSGSSACDTCKRNDKNNSATKCETGLPPSPLHKIYKNPRSPKKVNPYGGHGFSPERYITHLENTRDMMMRENRSQVTSPGKYKSGGSPISERSSFKTTSEGSPKLGLSSLATSSYPVTDGNSASDVTSEVTRPSTSYSSDEVSHSRYKIPLNRPASTEYSLTNEKSQNTSEVGKKRRQSVCIYMNSLDSPTVEIKSSTMTSESSHPTTQESLKMSESNTSNSENYSTPTLKDYETTGSLQIIDDLDSSSKTLISTSSSAFDSSSSTQRGTESDGTPLPQTTTTSETVITPETKTSETSSETSRTTTSTTNQDTSRNDSALSTRTSMTTDDEHHTKTPESGRSDKVNNNNINKGQTEQHIQNTIDFSDTGISLNCDTNRNSFNSCTSDAALSKPSSAEKSDSSTVVTNTVTCLDNVICKTTDVPMLKNTKLECIEVVVSETLNSSGFNNNKYDKKIVNTDDAKTKRKEGNKPLCTPDDIDQYVSNILIDSLNSMTNQINEINSNAEDDLKLNILEKEIKVKLQNLCPSPVNIPTNKFISSLITHIPDNELLETTVIEEKTRTLAYTTQSKMFPIESSIVKSTDGNAEESVKADYNIGDNAEFDNRKEYLGQSDSSPECDLLSFRSEVHNNNYVDLLEDKTMAHNESDSLHFYLNDLNENVDTSNHSLSDPSKKSVLDKLHRMFENSHNVDPNFNICETPANNIFCGSVYRDVSHLEMSTDVDVFVDNSLNKMIHNIDLCTDVQDLPSDNGNEQPVEALTRANDEKTNNNIEDDYKRKPSKHSYHPRVGNKKVISNIGSGSLYQKAPEKPIVVPRFSAVPNTESMEVNTSSDEDASSCESDCLSLIDSLDDPNSPRQLEYVNHRRPSKHDKTPVRGSIIEMLPENTTNNRSPLKEKSETFFIPIKGEDDECIKSSVVVAEHMPEKLKEKLIRRQQKREMRKEHRKKKMKQLKKDDEVKNDNELKQTKLDCSENVRLENHTFRLLDDYEDSKNKEKKKSNHMVKPIEESNKNIKKDMGSKKGDKNIKKFQSFIIDKRGDIKITNPKKNVDKEAKKDSKFNGFKTKIDCENPKNHQQERVEYNERNYSIPEARYNPNLSGPRRLYQKTEFKEGNKHVEILEIVECVDSSPEPQYDFDVLCDRSNSQKKSKIPVPVLEKLHKTTKRKPSNKLLKRCRSPISKSLPFNILVARNDQNHNRNVNTRIDQMIADILIDAMKEDNINSAKLRAISPLHDKKPMHPVIKKLVSSEILSKKLTSQTHTEKPSTIAKFNHFDVIPEERSSLSVDSQSEESLKNRKQSSSTGDMSDQMATPATNLSQQKIIPKTNVDDSLQSHSKLQNSLNQANQVLEIVTKNIDHATKKTVDAEVQSNISKKKVECYDVSTSPLPEFVSAATSPILLEHVDKKAGKKPMKGKKALTTKEGWAGFCKPQRNCSPEQEGSKHPSSNNPSDREAIEKISDDLHTSDSTVAPHSQRVLRRVDSRNNIKQIIINHKPPKPDKKVSSSRKDVLKEHNRDQTVHRSDIDKHKNHRDKQQFSTEDYSEPTKALKKLPRELSDEENRNELLKLPKHANKITEADSKRDRRNSDESKTIVLPSPFANQSYSRSCDSSSESDSEAVACPTLIPRWLPNSHNFRQRRTINRRHQRKDDTYRAPYQTGAGGWSVTLAGSCYTTLPSDVEMKVIFPKGNQQVTSQSDSGLGEESRPRKSHTVTTCKKCVSNLQVCKCLSAVKRQEQEESEREPFLPASIGRKSSKGSSVAHSGSLDQLSSRSKKYEYLPEVNLTSGNKSRSRKPSVQMDRRFSLHCWLPEDEPRTGQKMAKVQISESVGHPDGDELSVFGCAIMPEIKPRVPTMSERDLTRIHAAQFYSRTRRN